MGLSHSPRIITDGLVLCLDADNQKSWKGKPTTNIVTDASAFSGWSNYYRTLEKTSFTTEFGTTGWRFISQPSWSGLAKSYIVPSTGTYTFSAYYKYIGGTASNNGGTVYISGWGGGDTAVAVNKNLVGVWQRIQVTVNVTNLSGVFYLISYGGTDSGTTSPDNTSFEVTMPQIDAGSFATPFVDGTRSNTQVILDLTGLNTVTASSLTYNSNNTFSFNGSSNWIELPTSSLFDSQSITMESWNNPTTTSQNGFLFEKGQVNTQYSNFYNIDGTFYFRTIGLSPQDLTFTSSSYITTNKWNHVVCTVGNGTKVVYVNGNIVAQATGITGTMPTGQTNQYIGKYGSAFNEYPFNGSIAVSKVYNKALSAAEVQQNFNALRGRFGI